MGTNDIVMEGQKTPAELEQERTQSYLAALVREGEGYKQRLKGLEDEGRSDTADVQASLKAQIKDVEVELARYSDDREPRSKTHK